MLLLKYQSTGLNLNVKGRGACKRYGKQRKAHAGVEGNHLCLRSAYGFQCAAGAICDLGSRCR